MPSPVFRLLPRAMRRDNSFLKSFRSISCNLSPLSASTSNPHRTRSYYKFLWSASNYPTTRWPGRNCFLHCCIWSYQCCVGGGHGAPLLVHLLLVLLLLLAFECFSFCFHAVC